MTVKKMGLVTAHGHRPFSFSNDLLAPLFLEPPGQQFPYEIAKIFTPAEQDVLGVGVLLAADIDCGRPIIRVFGFGGRARRSATSSLWWC